MTSEEQFKHVQEHVLNNIKLLVEQLNRELQLADVMRLNIAIHTDHTIGRPIKVTLFNLRAGEVAPE